MKILEEFLGDLRNSYELYERRSYDLIDVRDCLHHVTSSVTRLSSIKYLIISPRAQSTWTRGYTAAETPAII